MLPGGRSGAGSGRNCSFQTTASYPSGRFPQYSEVAPAGAFRSGRCFQCGMGGAFPGWWLRLGRQGSGIADRIGQGQEVIRSRLLRSGGHRQAQNLPAPRDGKGISVLLAQIVTMGFGVGGQRSKDRGGIGVDVRQGSYR